jgi:hypothetical protein
MTGDNQEPRMSAAERTMELPQLPDATQGEVLEIRDSLREVRETMSLEHFNEYVAAELRMDEATAQDFLAFAATDRLTPRMWEYFERIARDATD